MKLWVGHYYGMPDEWFLAWARNKDDAALIIDGEVGEPDLRSLREVKHEGFIDLKLVKEDDPDGKNPFYVLHQIGDEEVERKEHYDNTVYFEELFDGLMEWFEKCNQEPFPIANEHEDNISKQMGIHQNDLNDLYKRLYKQ